MTLLVVILLFVLACIGFNRCLRWQKKKRLFTRIVPRGGITWFVNPGDPTKARLAS